MKAAGRVNDLLYLAAELVDLIHAHEIEAAAARVTMAAREMDQKHADCRGKKIQEISANIAAIKAARDRLREAVNQLPEREKIFARHQVEDAIAKLFGSKLAELRKEKVSLSHSN